MRKAMIGAKVIYCGHHGYFLADIMKVGSAFVVRANGKVSGDNIVRQDVEAEATHHLTDMHGGFWRPDLGVFVVPGEGLKLTQVGKDKIKAQEKFRAERDKPKIKKAA